MPDRPPPPGDAGITAAWRRTAASGLTPDARIDALPVVDVDPGSRLLGAAGPVLDRVAGELAGTGFSLMLADRCGRLVDQRAGGSRVRRALEELGGVVGRRFTEEDTGTNGVATVLETRRPVTVLAGQHYVEALRPYSCHGRPVVDRTTGRLTGVLDLTCPAGEFSALVEPLLRRVVDEIELRLISGAGAADQRLLAAFRAASRRRGRAAVVAFGRDAVLTNDTARGLLDEIDLAVLAALAENPADDGVHDLRLRTGRAVTARLDRVADAEGVVVTVRAREHVPVPGSGAPGWPVLVCGEPGTGRTRRAGALLDRPHTLDAAAAPVTAAALRAALAGNGDVLVESVDRLDPAAAHALAEALDHTAARVVLTGPPAAELPAGHRGVAARCPSVIEQAPLRLRTAELPRLAQEMLREIRGADARLSADAVRALVRRPWPGNLTELRAVLAVAAGNGGVITAADLPAGRGTRVARRLTLVEEAECATIGHALEVCGDNRRAAARLLSISPTTLYRRMRAFGLTDAR